MDVVVIALGYPITVTNNVLGVVALHKRGTVLRRQSGELLPLTGRISSEAFNSPLILSEYSNCARLRPKDSISSWIGEVSWVDTAGVIAVADAIELEA